MNLFLFLDLKLKNYFISNCCTIKTPGVGRSILTIAYIILNIFRG